MEQVILENFELPAQPKGPGDNGVGVFSFIYRGEKMDQIQEMYGRKNCCLKIFRHQIDGPRVFKPELDKNWWGHSSPVKGSPLTEATHIQNIYHHHGLAPRVYALFVVETNGKNYWAQLTDDLGEWEREHGKQNELMIGPMKEVADEYGITMMDDGNDYNVVGGKYVDFQGFHLPDDYKDRLKKKIKGVAGIGKWGPWENYHPIKKLGISGGRNNEERIDKLGLNEVDLLGKTVIDVGCSEGFFCFYANERGAKKVLGIDLPGVVKNLWELASYLGHYNVDFLGYDLLEEIPDVGNFDIVLFLSMVQHVGFPDWLVGMTNELLVFEGNSKNRDETAIARMDMHFSSIVKIGQTTDLFDRPVIWGKK